MPLMTYTRKEVEEIARYAYATALRDWVSVASHSEPITNDDVEKIVALVFRGDRLKSTVDAIIASACKP